MKMVCELNPGDLFLCDLGAHKGYFYRFVNNECYPDKSIKHSNCETVMFFMDGVWHYQTPVMNNWNPYCNVTLAKIEIVPL